MPSRIRLHVSKGTDSGKTFDVKLGQSLIVGRGSNSQTRLGDPEMSRVHFSLEYDGNRICISDLGSSTGTYLNGMRIEASTEADTGDEILAGGTRMFLSLVGHLESDTMAPSKNSILGELNGLIGTWVDSYFLRRIIGIGKTGLVFEAFDETKNRPAAVKVLSKKFTSDVEQRSQFIRGAKAFSKIQDPHLIRLYQAGRNSASYYYAAMELIDGESLDTLIERIGIGGMLDWKEVWLCAYQIATALVATYEQNVVHRNLVPRNIIRRYVDENYLLGDFTFAATISYPKKTHWYRQEFVSELHYLPPERVRDSHQHLTTGNEDLAGSTDIRSDIFGLGATCYALLTGKPPADGVDVTDIIENIRFDLPPMPKHSHMSINEQFQSVIMKMIAKKPTDRFQEPQTVVRELVRVAKINGLKI